ncbi:MAG: ABC transporter permease [Bdellovibrionales bacterium]
MFLLVLGVLFSILSPYFLSVSNIQNVITASAVIGLMALGATFVIAAGGIDLSSASVMALSGIVCASAIQDQTVAPFTAIVLCAGIGALCGFVTALLINITRAPSFIITLGMLSVARALAYLVADGMPVYSLPENVTAVGQGTLLGISGPVVFVIIAAMLAHIILHHSRFGSHILCLGDNPFAADAMGLNAPLLRIKAFTLAGLFSGIAGFVFMARTNAGDPTAGQNYELIAITAVILGGANLFGGRASIVGTLLGVICLGVLQNGLNLLAVSTYYQVLFVGLVLVAAAFLNRWRRA